MIEFVIFVLHSIFKRIMDFKTLMTLIKEGRKAKGLSQSDMAEKLGISLPTYSRYELGTTEMGVTTLLKIVQILDLEIFKGSGLIDETDLNIMQEIINKYKKN